jgi:tRNA pseudouridine38-40 synthase
MKILLKISFVGSSYCGWQAQNNGKTVQQTLTDAANKLLGFECDVTGCSRTDSGVHANMFCATVSKKKESSIETTIPITSLPRAINCFLPDDISVFDAELVPDDFHARYSVKYKEYIYKIYTRPERDAFLSGRVWHIPKKLDVTAMDKAAKLFVGKHDFSAFMAQGSKITDPTRTVFEAEVTCRDDIITFKVSADGFLYNMVRIMAGTLVDVGEGRIEPETVETIIKGQKRSDAGRTAPPQGLYLNKVVY